LKAHIAYLRYVLRHKWFVFLACRRLGVPLWRSIIHDWTKFTPAEWSPYVHQFYNPDGSKRQVNRADGGLHTRNLDVAFNQAWLHHQKHNPHHWQYWLLVNDEDGTVPLEVPFNYVLEMIADWDGAGRAITGKSDPAGWYEKTGHKMILHPETRELVEAILEFHYDWKPGTVRMTAGEKLSAGNPVYIGEDGKARKA
jgi:hypothetical protein